MNDYDEDRLLGDTVLFPILVVVSFVIWCGIVAGVLAWLL